MSIRVPFFALAWRPLEETGKKCDRLQTAMNTLEHINHSLICAICLDMASVDDAVETSCCHQLFCSSCIGNVSACPTCRKPGFPTVPAYFARRLIGNLMVACPNEGCTKRVSRSNLPEHLAVHCEFRDLCCPDPQCAGFKGGRKSFLSHLMSKHEELLVKNFANLWKKAKPVQSEIVVRSYPPPVVNPAVRVTAAAGPGDASDVDDRIERTRNGTGRIARLGSTGKFYCGGDLGSRCTCCNGRCGPGNGCNCSACMLLDVQTRKLSPGWFVNRDGASARCSSVEPDKFYCGRMVMTNDRRTDGYCGPTNGAHCLACQKLSEQRHSRYREIWSN